MDYLSEDTIKRATLSFMKTYYKFRPRAGETSISYDRVYPSGVVVDGYLTFPQEDGKPFVATFEATSSASAAEIRFRLQKQQLMWDGIATSTIATAVIMSVLWITNLWNLSGTDAGWLFSITLVLVLMFLSYMAFQMFFRSAERYRYIYAIEQFKQYHADEQWVALGKDVFDHSGEIFFNELKEQCVKNGFGLVTVSSEEHIDLLITPAREEVFGKKRRALKFDETPSVKSPLANLKRLSPQYLDRFRSSYLNQVMATFVSLGILIGIFSREYSLRKVDYVNEEAHHQMLENKKPGMTPETEALVYNKDQIIPYDSIKSAPVNVQVTPTTTDIGLYVYDTGGNGYIKYDCSRIDFSGTKYVVQDHIYPTFDEAYRRIEQLKKYSFICNAISLSCIEPKNKGYCVYYEALYGDMSAAKKKMIMVKTALDEINLPHDNVKLYEIKF